MPPLLKKEVGLSAIDTFTQASTIFSKSLAIAMMKVDLHSHTQESISKPSYWLGEVLGTKDSYIKARDSYYQAIKVRKLHGLAITNHNVIGDALELAKEHPEHVIVGCEYTVNAGDGYKLHVITLDLNEKIHKELNSLRNKGLRDFIQLLQHENIPYFLTHIGVSVVPKLKLKPELIDGWVSYFYAIETLNSLRIRENSFAKKIARYYHLAEVGGSDAHDLNSIGRAYTVSPTATNLKEFLEDFRQKKVYPAGEQGSIERFETEIKSIIRSFYLSEFRPVIHKGLLTHIKEAGARRLLKNVGEALLLFTYPWLPKAGSIEYIKEQSQRVSALEDEYMAYLKEKETNSILSLPYGRQEKINLWRERMERICDAFAP